MTTTEAVGMHPPGIHSRFYPRLLFVFSMRNEIQIAAPVFKDYGFPLPVIDSKTSKESNRDDVDWYSS